jgi:hypothetical protein
MADAPTEPSAVFSRVWAATKEAQQAGRLRAPLPEALYHFTDIHALKAIVTSRKLRVSLSTALNDASEGLYGLRLAGRTLRELPAEKRPFGKFLTKMIDEPSLLPREIHQEIFPVVACFCAGEQSSSQWLNYGRGGRGVAIGFNPKFLQKVTGVELIKVDYLPESQRPRIQSVIDAAQKAWEAEAQLKGQYGLFFAAYIARIGLSLLAPELKDPSFDSEQEWRLLGHQGYVDGQPVKGDLAGSTPGPFAYRITEDGRLLPYEDLPFPETEEEPIKSVVLGYSSPVDISAVRLLLHERGIRAKVSRSEVPVR